MAFSNAREVIVMHPIFEGEDLHDRILGHMEPFGDPDSSINSLAFSSHEVGWVNLVVGTTGGLAVYSIEATSLRLIQTYHNHR
ncbi:hypothetical protein FRC08_002697, partial [Ceratobasidium sp. 394]